MDYRADKAIHPTLTEQQIAQLVDRFYSKIRDHHRLGPIFETRLEGRWPQHLSKMKDFWSSVLLHSGRYKGRPLPVHLQLEETISDDYKSWLVIFRSVVWEVFDPTAAPLVIEIAERIALNFWLAIFATPFDATPDWISTSSNA